MARITTDDLKRLFFTEKPFLFYHTLPHAYMAQILIIVNKSIL